MEHVLTLKLCRISEGRLLPRGEAVVLPIKEAIARLAPSGEHRAKLNVVVARTGNYLGLINRGKMVNNFLLASNSGNDISWLLKKEPGIEAKILEVYLVEDVTIPKSSEDLPTTNLGSG